MLGISVELGTYSIKFLNYQVDKKSVHLVSTDEIVVERSEDPEEKIWKNQISLVHDYLAEIETDYQLLMHIPSEIVSSRFLNLPVKNKKKATLMLPFQIEEDLPYPLTNCHWAESLEINEESTAATVGIIRKEHFEDFFFNLKSNNVSPNVLTSDVSSIQNLVKKNPTDFPQSFCVINIGHETTRGFYFFKGELVANHHSYIAGKALTDAISKTYSISLDEATLYKHQNSFLLLEEQYEQVNENQKEFAKVMDTTMASLLSEIKRWDIGFRVQHGEPIKDIYICGGTSNIKNIQNYLSTKLNADVKFFDPYKFVDSGRIDQDEKQRRKYSQVTTLCWNTGIKTKLINFLKGDYALNSSNELPLESVAFIGLRLGALAFFISLTLLVRTFQVSGDVKEAKKFTSKLLKNPVLKDKISKSLIRRSANNPNLIINKLNSQEKVIKQEVKVIQSSLKVNIFSSLSDILNIINGQDVEIIKFVASEDKNIDLILSADKVKKLEDVQALFKNDKERKWFLDLNKKKLTLSIGGKGK